ncbi:hypothetical protein [Patulibacter sp. SYSU D01012]|uniref:hypothetical protein n=1 Tax=Patulibacter sp. SYSU D01012 TaxID=2817381 RepID=UPI001B316CF0|nr:hypothetical protein [Patulibacter sp. SYSU D01012]
MTANSLPRSVRRAAPVAAMLAGALAVAGCGGDDKSADEPPAKATPASAAQAGQLKAALSDDVPANAAAFAETSIRPQGDTKATIEQIAGMFGVQDPGDELIKALDMDEPLDSGKTFKDDVLPLLGDHVGGFVLGGKPAGKQPVDAAVVAEVKDTAKLEQILAPEMKDAKKTTLDGATVYRDDDVVAWFGEDELVVGTEAGVKAAIAAAKGGTLAESERYKGAIAQVRASGDAAAVVWADLQQADTFNRAFKVKTKARAALSSRAQRDLGGSFGGSTPMMRGWSLDGGQIPKVDATVAAAILGKPGRIKVETGGTLPADIAQDGAQSAKDGAAAVANLPAGSWFAAGGSTSLNVYKGTGQDPLTALSQIPGVKISDRLKDALGKVRTAAIGVRGDSLMSIGGAVTMWMADAASAKALLDELASLAQKNGLPAQDRDIEGADAAKVAPLGQLPTQLAAAVKGDTFVIGLGTSSVEAALGKGGTLSGEQLYKDAQAALGGDAPMVLVKPQAFGDLLNGVAGMGGRMDRETQQAMQVLSRIKLVAASQAFTGPKTFRGTLVVDYDGSAPAPAGTTTSPGR